MSIKATRLKIVIHKEVCAKNFKEIEKLLSKQLQANVEIETRQFIY